MIVGRRRRWPCRRRYPFRARGDPDATTCVRGEHAGDTKERTRRNASGSRNRRPRAVDHVTRRRRWSCACTRSRRPRIGPTPGPSAAHRLREERVLEEAELWTPGVSSTTVADSAMGERPRAARSGDPADIPDRRMDSPRRSAATRAEHPRFSTHTRRRRNAKVVPRTKNSPRWSRTSRCRRHACTRRAEVDLTNSRRYPRAPRMSSGGSGRLLRSSRRGRRREGTGERAHALLEAALDAAPFLEG